MNLDSFSCICKIMFIQVKLLKINVMNLTKTKIVEGKFADFEPAEIRCAGELYHLTKFVTFLSFINKNTFED